jgi:hypothetical protein
MCAFILLKLSGSRDFCISLNRPFSTHLPIDLPLFTGTHADLLAITVHKVIANGTQSLRPLYGCMITTICNVSPYWRGLSLTASLKVVNLLEIFTSNKKLYTDTPSSEENIGHAALILEIFNNVVQYQFTGNEQLVYALIRKKGAFLKLTNLKAEIAASNWRKVHKVAPPETPTTAETTVAPPPPPTTPPAPSDGKVGLTSPPPDCAWVERLKAKLPLDTVTRLLKSVEPLIDDMVSVKDGVVDEEDILTLLRSTTLVGLLPVPHPIVIRQYRKNDWTGNWFTAYLWGVIFLRNQKLPVFDGDSIKLFQVTARESKA